MKKPITIPPDELSRIVILEPDGLDDMDALLDALIAAAIDILQREAEQQARASTEQEDSTA